MPTRILFVEDNPGDVRLVQEMLAAFANGCIVTHVQRIDESIPLLDSGEVDLVLLDLSLPDSTGLETFDRIRAQSPDVPIVILTGQQDIEAAREALRRGAQDYLVKGQLEGNLLLHAVHYSAERHAVRQELEELSLRDPLTGLYNRRGFTLLAEQSLRLAKRNGRESVLLLADVDGLKAINDAHGHLGGDEALCAVARSFAAAMRDSDIISRLAGDEFVVLAVEANPPGIPAIVTRIENRLSEERQRCAATRQLSVSIGIAPFDPKTAPTLKELTDAADKDMYIQKRERSERPNCHLSS
jgi:two-component system cell cycle response regulator